MTSTSTSAVEAKIEAVTAALEPKCRGFGHGNLPMAIAREFATAAVSAIATLDQGDGHACAVEAIPDGWIIAPWKIGRERGESDDAYKARAEATGATHGLASWGELHEFSHKPWSLERAPHATPGWVGVRRAPIPAPEAWTDDDLEPAARALFKDVFPEDVWEDCPGLHDDVFASLRAAIAKLPTASLNATPAAETSLQKMQTTPPAQGHGAVGAGWKLVPEKPSVEMLAAGGEAIVQAYCDHREWDSAKDAIEGLDQEVVWRAMWGAAPAQPDPDPMADHHAEQLAQAQADPEWRVKWAAKPEAAEMPGLREKLITLINDALVYDNEPAEIADGALALLSPSAKES